LKNDRDLLPLDINKIKSLAVTGPGAEYIAYGRGSGEVYAEPQSMVTPLQGIRHFVNGKADVFHFAWSKTPARASWEQSAAPKAKGKQANKGPELPAMPEITDAAKAKLAAAGAIIFCAVDTPHGEGGDLDNIDLPWKQVEAIKTLAAINPHVIVVLQIGQPVMLNEVSGTVPAMLVAWYAGQSAGDSIADIIFGETNPSGKLSSTFARDMKDYPLEALGLWPPKMLAVKTEADAGTTAADRKATHAVDADYKEGVFIGYRWFDKQGVDPLFAFGHGLSYTQFAMSGYELIQNGPALRVACVVENTGKRTGSEVVQVYVAPPKGATANADVESARPVRELKGFARVTLQPGESRRVEITLPRDALCRFDEKKGDWVTDSGEYTLEVGTSSRDIKARLPYGVSGK